MGGGPVGWLTQTETATVPSGAGDDGGLASWAAPLLAPTEAPPPQTFTIGSGPAAADAAPAATPAAEAEPVVAWHAHLCPLPAELTALIHPRIVALVQLDGLHQQRLELRQADDLAEDARTELDRQDRESRRPLSAEQTEKAAAEQKRREEAHAAKVEAGEAEPPSADYVQALELAYEQWRLFAEWDALRPKILATAWTLAQNEPLFVLLQRGARSPQALFAWAVYGSALRSVRQWAMDQRAQTLAQLEHLRRQPLERVSLEASEQLLARVILATERDQALVEQEAVKAFWEQYEEAAALWVGGGVAPDDQPRVRAFLRYGMIGGAPWFMQDDLAQALLRQCAQEVPEWNPTCAATHVLYADEYLWYVSQGVITPAIDEDLDLNGRGKPEWKRDKAWRRVIYGRSRQGMLVETLGWLDQRVKQLEATVVSDEQRTPAGERAADPRRAAARQKDAAARDRVEALRLGRVRDRLRDYTLPDERHWHAEAVHRLLHLEPLPLTPDLGRREARQLRRVCWLTAKLKDRFPPFTLAENYRPGTPGVHTREAVLAELAEVEKRDMTIFKEPLNPGSKPQYRVYMRQSPYVILSPGCGFLGLS